MITSEKKVLNKKHIFHLYEKSILGSQMTNIKIFFSCATYSNNINKMIMSSDLQIPDLYVKCQGL